MVPAEPLTRPRLLNRSRLDFSLLLFLFLLLQRRNARAPANAPLRFPFSAGEGPRFTRKLPSENRWQGHPFSGHLLLLVAPPRSWRISIAERADSETVEGTLERRFDSQRAIRFLSLFLRGAETLAIERTADVVSSAATRRRRTRFLDRSGKEARAKKEGRSWEGRRFEFF